jgi:hypothetical protein
VGSCSKFFRLYNVADCNPCSELHMFRRTILAPSHYAGKWIIPEEDQHYDLKAVNLLGYAYATAPDSAAKEAKLLEVLECFHGYPKPQIVLYCASF